jgi:small-conductance mechanosensitive channel
LTMDEVYHASWISSPFIESFVAAVLAILLGFIIARLAGMLVRRILQAIEINRVLSRADQGISSTVEFLLYAGAVVYALNLLGLGWVAVFALAGVLLLLFLAAVLSAAYFLPSILAGLKVGIKKGDQISISRVKGSVEKVGLAHTIVIGKNGERIFVPNVLLSADALKH